MPVLKWLQPLMNHVPDECERLVRCDGFYYPTVKGGVRRQAAALEKNAAIMIIHDPAPDTLSKMRSADLDSL